MKKNLVIDKADLKDLKYRLPHFEKVFVVIDQQGNPIHTSTTNRQAMIDICQSEAGLKLKYRLLEAQVTKINIFGAFSGETTF